MKMTEEKSSKIQVLEKICDITEKKFDFLSQIDTSHKNRATTIFVFGAAILSIIFSLLPNKSLFLPLFIIGTLFVFISLVFSVIVILSWNFQIEPDPKIFDKDYIKKDYEEVLSHLLRQLKGGYEENRKTIQKKAIITDLGFIFMLVGLFCIVLSILIK